MPWKVRLVYHYLAFTGLQLVRSGAVRLGRRGDKFRPLVMLRKSSVTPIVERCPPLYANIRRCAAYDRNALFSHIFKMADFPRCMAVFSGYVLVIFCRSLEALRPKNILDRLGDNHSIRLRCLFFQSIVI